MVGWTFIHVGVSNLISNPNIDGETALLPEGQGCGTGKFEDGSDILSEYGSGSGSYTYVHTHLRIHIHIRLHIRKRIRIHILKHILIHYIYTYVQIPILRTVHACTYSICTYTNTYT
jgi:hypothetical protein